MSEDDLIATGSGLSTIARERLAAILGEMVPASAEYGVPGADDPAILDDILRTGAAMLPMLAAALDEMDEPGLDAFQRAHPDLVGLLIALVAQCYYRDDRVMESLGMDARPPYPGGFEVEDGDWSLLDPVKARKPMYRKVDRLD